MTPAATPTFDHEALVMACARGDAGALRALYEHEGRWLLGVALRLVRERAAAEDVLHDAFVQVWRSAATFEPALGSARGWIYTIVRHTALRHLRRRERAPTLDPHDLTEQLDARTASGAGDAWDRAAPDAAERGLDARALARCLGRLDPARARCVEWAFLDGLTHEAIAERLARPVGTVKSWIRRSLASLRECLS